MIEKTHVMYEDIEGSVRVEPIAMIGLRQVDNEYYVCRYTSAFNSVRIEKETYDKIADALLHKINLCLV